MATSIFFNGRLISVPGSYSEVDVSGLEAVGLSAAGIVAILGTAEGGKPASAMTRPSDFMRVRKPDAGRALFRSGDLREAMGLAFEPSSDTDIPGGAVEVVAMKVNPATQATAIFSNTQGDAMNVASLDYGAFTEQINVSIAPGTTKGKLLSIQFEDSTEAVDDLGGDNSMTLTYAKPTGGWDTIAARINAGGVLRADATRATLGLDSDITTPLAAPGAIEVVSSAAGDTTQQITVYGLDGTGAPKSETLLLNGTTARVGTQIWGTAGVLGAAITGTTAGTVTVRASGGGATVMTLAAGANPVKGLVRGVCMYANGVATVVADGASTANLLIVGKNAAGAVQLEKLTLAGAVPVVGAAIWSSITAIVLGAVAAARTITTSGIALLTTPAIQSTMQKVADYTNARAIAGTGGFALVLVTSQTTMSPTELDVSVSAVSCLSPANPGFKADLYAILNWINQNSELISATAASGATGGAPSDTVSPTFLQGGSEGTTLFTHWQNALNLLKQTRVNTVVCLTADPAVHAAQDAHCAYMGGIGRSERDAIAGAMNTAMTGLATKTEVKAQIVDLNSRHTRVWAQSIERYNSAGERQTFYPPFGAVVIAGMQAGSVVGTPLTHKYMNILSYDQHSSWNPTDDAEELVQAGLVFCENVEGVGRRVVRNVTTHLSSNNIAFTEGSVNQAVNFATYNFRTNMEFAVGKKGFSGTVNAAKSVAIGTLGLLVDSQILVASRALNIELVLDVMEVGVEIAPVLPINFVRSIIHLVTIRQVAA